MNGATAFGHLKFTSGPSVFLCITVVSVTENATNLCSQPALIDILPSH